LKPAQANSLRDPTSKKPTIKKRAGRMAQDVGLEFKPQYHKIKGKKRYRNVSLFLSMEGLSAATLATVNTQGSRAETLASAACCLLLLS
jgi:hypothetical protein